MNKYAQGLGADPWELGAANEEFLEGTDLGAQVYVHTGWDPYAAWRARVKATFSLQSQNPAELLT